jgi:hypothetical protein
MTQLIKEAKRFQELAGINEVKIEPNTRIKNYKNFVDIFNKVFSKYVELLDVESIKNERDEREEGETYMLSLDKIDMDVTVDKLEDIFNKTFSKHNIELAEIEDAGDYFIFYIEPIDFKIT